MRVPSARGRGPRSQRPTRPEPAAPRPAPRSRCSPSRSDYTSHFVLEVHRRRYGWTPLRGPGVVTVVPQGGAMKRTLAVPVLVVLVAGWSALGAGGAGGPSPGIKFASSGVLSRDGSTRYVALYANRGTVVESVRTRDGSIDRSVYFRGTYGLPFVAFDGSTGGLSADGRRLVLSTWPAYGRKAFTRFVVLDPRTLRIRSRLDLEGAFAFDALSPSGSVMYLTRFLGGPGSGRYGVRALSLDTKRLYPGAIIDRRE